MATMLFYILQTETVSTKVAYFAKIFDHSASH